MVPVLAAMPPAVSRRHRWPVIGAAVLLGGIAVGQLAVLGSGAVDPVTTAAVTSGTESVMAWLFGSLDGGSAITVDSPPAALWLMVLSARLFGISTFSLLLPQALLAVGAVALTWAGVRRRHGSLAALFAGAAVAAATLVTGRDHGTGTATLLLFSLAAAGYAVVRALHSGSWLIVAGVALGIGILAEPAATVLVIPAYGLLYLVAATQPLTDRLRHLAGAVCAMAISAGWFLLLVAWWPADRRPYVSWWDGGAWRELLTHPGGVGWLAASAVLLWAGAVLWQRRRTAALVLGAVALLLGSLGAAWSIPDRAATDISATSSPRTSTAVANLLSATDSRWSGAVVGEPDAASAMLASHTAVLPLGGPDGAQPVPTLAQFQSYVSGGEISYLLIPGSDPTAPGTAAAQITGWVKSHYSPTQVNGATVYDLR